MPERLVSSVTSGNMVALQKWRNSQSGQKWTENGRRNEDHYRRRQLPSEAGVQRLAQAWSEMTRYQAPEGYAELLR